VGGVSSGKEWSFGYALYVANVFYLARIRNLVVIDPNFEVVHVGCFALIFQVVCYLQGEDAAVGWWGLRSFAGAKWGVNSAAAHRQSFPMVLRQKTLAASPS
jgi:hypothetical protein